jgi:hypothetical protein
LNPADARGNRAFFNEGENADVRRIMDVGATAKFLRIIAEFNDADIRAILLGEFHFGSEFLRFFDRQDLRLLRDRFRDLGVDFLFDAPEFFRSQFAARGEVETEVILIDVGAFLIDVAPQDIAKGFMKKVGRRVIALDQSPPRNIDR